jgi:hypothetical protein
MSRILRLANGYSDNLAPKEGEGGSYEGAPYCQKAAFVNS